MEPIDLFVNLLELSFSTGGPIRYRRLMCGILPAPGRRYIAAENEYHLVSDFVEAHAEMLQDLSGDALLFPHQPQKNMLGA